MQPSQTSDFLAEHAALSRRWFLGLATGAIVSGPFDATGAAPPVDALAGPLAKLEPYFTSVEDFRDVSRGTPLPHSLSDAKKREVGLTRETWKLDVIGDADHPPKLTKQFMRKDRSALTFADLLRLGEKHGVRFAKIMTCLNIGCPLGMGLWEGVPLREVIWLTKPKSDLRRVVYHGYHNDDPKQLFRASLPIGRVLEDYGDLPPVILCYKLNGRWLDSVRGGPVRIVVPEAYGFKSIKWLSHVILTNLAQANDTYAHGNNDIDSPLKTFAATLFVPSELEARAPIPVTGYAQVGISGLSKVQVWISSNAKPWPSDDPYFREAPWRDARILPAPKKWGGKLPGDRIPKGTHGFDTEAGAPRTWPMRLCKIHWATLLPGLPAGDYTLRCRTVDAKGHGQPMPRPFRKSGHCEIEAVRITIKA
jgi:DMSO/TMAO reductase YedYZ molybdopterin-dependent catalytic subunit